MIPQIEIVHSAAYETLTKAGILPDRDLLAAIDLSPVTVKDGIAHVPPGFAEGVRIARPYWFRRAAGKSAMAMSDAEFKDAVRNIDRDDARRRRDVADRRYLAALEWKYRKAE